MEGLCSIAVWVHHKTREGPSNHNVETSSGIQHALDIDHLLANGLVCAHVALCAIVSC